MRFGIDRLEDDNFAQIEGKRVGLYTNLNAVNCNLIPGYRLLHAAENVQLAALFSPEHGLSGMFADAVVVNSGVDEHTGLPVHSLYGETYRPTKDMLANIDLMICDIQDIGVRYYTFLWTLTHILEACGEYGVPVLVLDRPNPLASRVDGGGLDLALASLVGRFPIPIQHGMTMGEMALMINATWNITPAEVEVLPCDGWKREQTWPVIGRAFVPPSPNIPHLVTVQHYPGACLIEGTTLSEGRGTPLPFEIVGAPYIHADALAEALNSHHLAGVQFRPMQFLPTASKYNGQQCYGIQAHITQSEVYKPLVVWLTVIRTIHELYPDDFAWLPPYEANGVQHFDRLIGDDSTRKLIDAHDSFEKMLAAWEDFQNDFKHKRKPYLLYDE